jgi:hypothetical protein
MAQYKPKLQSSFQIKISPRYSTTEREAIAQEVIDYITTRTKSGVSPVTGRPFAGYSKEYVKSLNFKIARKNKNKVDLTLTGDMLGVIELIEDTKGKMIIGIDERKFPDEAAKAEGNQLGTYGNPKPVVAGRKFLGITKAALNGILENYPLEENQKKIERVKSLQKISNMSEED